MYDLNNKQLKELIAKYRYSKIEQYKDYKYLELPEYQKYKNTKDLTQKEKDKLLDSLIKVYDSIPEILDNLEQEVREERD